MYFTETADCKIYAYDFDSDTGNISNKRTFFHATEEGAAPDGHAMDEEEHLWVCVFGLGKVLRISPEGQIVAEIHLPTRCPTCPAFVGEDLYITSTHEQSPADHPESVKYQGNLFRCHVGVKGCRLNKFKYNGPDLV